MLVGQVTKVEESLCPVRIRVRSADIQVWGGVVMGLGGIGDHLISQPCCPVIMFAQCCPHVRFIVDIVLGVLYEGAWEDSFIGIAPIKIGASVGRGLEQLQPPKSEKEVTPNFQVLIVGTSIPFPSF